jgi:catechol 2,3-dioxygenase-like lactoylglutathione lyase family enzyme
MSDSRFIHIALPVRSLEASVVFYSSREEVDRLCGIARAEACLVSEPVEFGPPVGYWAYLRDPDGHTLELAYGQHVSLIVETFI